MIIKYKFATGEVTEVEVSDEIGTVIVDSRREEHANNERHRYHTAFSLDDMTYEDKDYFSATDNPEEAFMRKEAAKQRKAMLSQLTPVQRRRFEKYEGGMSIAEIGTVIMKSYTFYFDESFHDKKIRISENGKFNILREGALDNYIGLFWGCPTSELASNRKLIQKFENRQKAQYGLAEEQEFKSTVIAKKNFKYGIRSFNKVTMTFYRELFELIDILNPVIQVNMVSKMELYLRLAFKGLRYLGQGELLEKTFFYTLTKFMITYHNEELLKALYS